MRASPIPPVQSRSIPSAAGHPELPVPRGVHRRPEGDVGGQPLQGVAPQRMGGAGARRRCYGSFSMFNLCWLPPPLCGRFGTSRSVETPRDAQSNCKGEAQIAEKCRKGGCCLTVCPALTKPCLATALQFRNSNRKSAFTLVLTRYPGPSFGTVQKKRAEKVLIPQGRFGYPNGYSYANCYSFLNGVQRNKKYIIVPSDEDLK